MALAQLARPMLHAARPAPRGSSAGRAAAPARVAPARVSRLVPAAKRSDDDFDSVFTSRSAAMAYVCTDCGFIYTDARPFEKLPSSYKCPSCKAPKSSFVEKDVSAANAVVPALAAVAVLAAIAAYAVQQL